MSVSVGRTKLVTALKDLRMRWDKVRSYWDDPVAKEFETQFLEPLEGKVRSGVTAMENMNQLLMKAKRDCQ